MKTVEDVQRHLTRLQGAVWELAAMTVALRDAGAVDPDQRRAAEQVLVESGLLVESSDGPQPSTGLAARLGAYGPGVAAEVSTAILQSAALLSGANTWTTQDDAAILAQGRASAQAAAAFKMFALPMMDGLGDLLSGMSPRMLDVGVGVASLAVAYCEAFPGLRVVGLDVFPRALELARSTVDDAGMTDRVELRHQDVAELDDVDTFCLGWLPAPFVPRPAVEKGLPRMVSALVPGGWIMVGHGKFDGDPLDGAITRFQTVAFGGTAINNHEAEALLRGVGLELVASLSTPAGAPGITVGRRPRSH